MPAADVITLRLKAPQHTPNTTTSAPPKHAALQATRAETTTDVLDATAASMPARVQMRPALARPSLPLPQPAAQRNAAYAAMVSNYDIAKPIPNKGIAWKTDPVQLGSLTAFIKPPNIITLIAEKCPNVPQQRWLTARGVALAALDGKNLAYQDEDGRAFALDLEASGVKTVDPDWPLLFERRYRPNQSALFACNGTTYLNVESNELYAKDAAVAYGRLSDGGVISLLRGHPNGVASVAHAQQAPFAAAAYAITCSAGGDAHVLLWLLHASYATCIADFVPFTPVKKADLSLGARNLLVVTTNAAYVYDIRVHNANDPLFGKGDLSFSPTGNRALIYKDRDHQDEPTIVVIKDQAQKRVVPAKAVTAAAFSPDERLLATAYGTQIQLWDLQTPIPTLIAQLDGPLIIQGLRFSLDGKSIYLDNADASRPGKRLCPHTWDISELIGPSADTMRV